MHDQIKVGDLVYLKKRINLCKDNSDDICVVVHKENTKNDFLYKILYKGVIKTYDTAHFHRNIILEPVNHV